jgi:alpha-galactosidase
LTKASEDEKQEMKKQIQDCKEVRYLTMFGDFYRIISPFESNEACWMVLSKDKNEVMLCYFRILAKPN